MKVKAPQITRIPYKYLDILKTQPKETVGKLFINILGGDEELTDNERIFFNLIMTDVNNINGQAEVGSKQGHHGSSGGRPKEEKVNRGGLDNETPGGGEIEPQDKISKDNIIQNKIKKDKTIKVKENDNILVKPLNEVTENEKKTIASFIRYQYDNKKQMKTMIDNKGPDKYLQTSIDEYCKLLKKYTTQEIIEVLQYIVKDTFRQNNILSIRKLSDKNKDGFKFIDVILDRIKTPQNNVTIANIF